MKDILKDCFKLALKEEQKGIKHKGLLITKPNIEEAKGYLERAQESLKFCEIYKKVEADYKIPEEWFYSLYYCALAILAKFGVESRSQKYTALLLEYLQEKKTIGYDKEFVNRIKVYQKIDAPPRLLSRGLKRCSIFGCKKIPQEWNFLHRNLSL